MSSLDADDLELEEYFDVLFNSTEALTLLVSSVQSDSEAQQAVLDVIANNTQVGLFVMLCSLAGLEWKELKYVAVKRKSNIAY